MTIKETGRSLVPHTLTKRPDPKASKPTKPSVTQGLSNSSASPSAIKAAAKSAALQLAKQMAADDQESDEELSPENYFSLGDNSLPLPAVDPSLDPEPGAPSALLPNPAAAETGSFQSDAPLEFGPGGEEASGSVWVGQQHAPLHPQYLEPSVEPAPEPLPQVTGDQEVTDVWVYSSSVQKHAPVQWFSILILINESLSSSTEA